MGESPGAFVASTNLDITVAEACSVSPPAIWFRRELTQAKGQEWDSLRTRLNAVTLGASPDEVSWCLSASRQFSVKSMYEKLTQSPMLDVVRGLWKAALPLKVKIFLRQLFRNRVPTSINVAKSVCAVCSEPEGANHVFFRCHLARFAWSATREASGQAWNPRSGLDLLEILRAQRGANKRIMWRCACALLRALWHVRKQIIIESISPSHPTDVLFKVTYSCSNGRRWGKRDAVDMQHVLDKLHNVQSVTHQPASHS